MRIVRFFQLAIILLLAIAPFSVLAQSSTPEASPTAETYVDPAGQFSVPIPTSWTVDDSGPGVVLSDPEGDFSASIIVVENDSVADAIDQAYETLLPDLERASKPTVTPSEPPEGVDEVLIVTDDLGDTSGQVAQALGMRVESQVHVLILTGTYDAALRRQSQIQLIATGYQIISVNEPTLDPGDANPFTDETAASMNDFIISALKDLNVPGASVAIIRSDQIVFSAGYGTTGNNDQPVQTSTRMMIGSITKSMTTMMMASMVADGLFAWDTKVVDLYPDFALSDPDLTAKIEMQDLVCACTGVPRRDYDFLFNGQDTPEQMIARLAGFPLSAAMDETYQYSNQMVAAAGFIAAHTEHPELPMDQAYAESLRARVFDPIGMTDSTLDFATVEASGTNAVPFGVSGLDGYVPMPVSIEETLIPIAPAGAVWSTANDMARYLMTQMHDGVAPDGTIAVDAEALARTKQPRIALDAHSSYGMGWVVSDRQGIHVVAHDGATFGFSSMAQYMPQLDLGIVVLANGQVADTFTQAIIERLWELTFDQPETAQQSVTDGAKTMLQQHAQFRNAVTDPPKAETVAYLLGSWTNPDLGTVNLRFNDAGALLIETGEFTSEVRFLKGTPQPTLILIDPPVAGGMFTIDKAAGTLTISDGTTDFVFTHQDTATPVA